jgi:hypothetical protein
MLIMDLYKMLDPDDVVVHCVDEVSIITIK